MLTSIMIERWIYTYLSLTIVIKSQVSIIKWWVSILNDGYPLYGIRNRAYARLFAVGFPCIHICDWQMKIMDILNSIINIRVFFVTIWPSVIEFVVNYFYLITNFHNWIMDIHNLVMDIHVIELWISIDNHTYRWPFAVVFYVFTSLTNKWKSMIIVKLIVAFGHTWLNYGYP